MYPSILQQHICNIHKSTHVHISECNPLATPHQKENVLECSLKQWSGLHQFVVAHQLDESSP
jgi:hypothetical protein